MTCARDNDDTELLELFNAQIDKINKSNKQLNVKFDEQRGKLEGLCSNDAASELGLEMPMPLHKVDAAVGQAAKILKRGSVSQASMQQKLLALSKNKKRRPTGVSKETTEKLPVAKKPQNTLKTPVNDDTVAEEGTSVVDERDVVRKLLQKVNLAKFTDTFMQEGHTDPTKWKRLTNAQLKGLGLTKKLKKRFRKLND